MNMILLFPGDFTDRGHCRARLSGQRHKHIYEVLRAVEGDELRVGILGGRVGKGTIARINEEGVDIKTRFYHEPPPPAGITLILALPRPPVMRRTLSAVTALGIKDIYLIGARRVEKSFWRSSMLHQDRIKERLIMGLEQSGDTLMPRVRARHEFGPFIRDELPTIIRGTLFIAAHPGAGEPCPSDVREKITLVIGPEGGFVPFEIEALKSAGCRIVHLGARTLRVETAVPALIGRLLGM